ncbi:hypothetical protein AB0K21_08580 [Streptosporangium sp. NPDC049248]|uniref:IS1096 element passenger TnpR family protein n=1 Tax=Streptosporangium sp. NPDC049248 TaxID=3155651 RepID=UPI003436DA4E
MPFPGEWRGVGGRACPPEDSGGPEGFADLLRALWHKKGSKYRQTRDILGASRWDGAAWDRQEVNDQLAEQRPWWPPGKLPTHLS